MNLRDSYASLDGAEVWIHNVHINPYSHRGYVDHDPKRKRRLLLHKYEIRKLIGKTVEKGLTLVPTRMYFKNGKIKVQIALAKGKQDHDKRETIRRREADRETRAAVKERVPSECHRRRGPTRAVESADCRRGRTARPGYGARLNGEHEVIPWTRATVDLTRHTDVREAIVSLAPQAIVKLRELHNVDLAEDEQVTALDVNAMVVGTLARAAANLDAG